jgi:SOS-response transcriptional repressor LexA
MIGLTPVMQNAVAFMIQQKDQAGVYPSYQEIADHIGLKSKSRVCAIMYSLEERGAVRRMPGRARGYEVVPEAEARMVLVGAHLWAPLIQYAIAERITLETAVNAFISDGLTNA